MPSFPLDLVPTGQLGMVLTPTSFANSLLIALKCLVKTNVVPLLSARTITLIGASGNLASGLSFAMTGSFHLVILPLKIPTYASRDNFKLGTSLRLAPRQFLPAVMGRRWTPPSTFATPAG